MGTVEVVLLLIVVGGLLVLAGWWIHGRRERGDTTWPYWLIAVAPALVPLRTLIPESFMFAVGWVVVLLCGWWLRDKRRPMRS